MIVSLFSFVTDGVIFKIPSSSIAVASKSLVWKLVPVNPSMKIGDFGLKVSILKFMGKYLKKFSFNFLVESLIALMRVVKTIRGAGI